MYHTRDFVDAVVRDRTSAAAQLSEANRQLGLAPTVRESVARFAGSFLSPFRRTGMLERRTGGERRIENLTVAFERRAADRRVASIPVAFERRVAERRMAAA